MCQIKAFEDIICQMIMEYNEVTKENEILLNDIKMRYIILSHFARQQKNTHFLGWVKPKLKIIL